VRRQVFVLTAGFVLFVSALVYAGLVAVLSVPGQPEAVEKIVNQSFLLWVSLLMLPFSLLYAFLVTVLDNQRSDPNIRAEVEGTQRQLEKQFDELGGTQ
jgi:peptidoglycan biosynthesis protein MviN/MurJ (putative lipid II flippase)